MTNSDSSAKTSIHPLVSVICRSINRPLVNQALASVAQQSYKPVEVVLVDSLSKGVDVNPDVLNSISITQIKPPRALGRSASANAGLKEAKGDYLMFLDDDDWVDPEHIQNLVDTLVRNRNCLAAYSSVRVAAPDGSPGEKIFAQDFDPVLLRRDNYIPIHAVLFSRSLLDKGCRFDESLDIYEDWDFWLQVSRETAFVHVDKITAHYRQGGNSATADVNAQQRYSSGNAISTARNAVLKKWMQTWSGQELNELLGSMDKSEELARQDRELQRLDGELQQLNGRLVQADNQIREQLTVMQEKDRALDQLQHKFLACNENLEQTREALADSRDHAQTLDSQLNRIYRSWSWRLMGPFRRLYRLVSGTSDSAKD